MSNNQGFMPTKTDDYTNYTEMKLSGTAIRNTAKKQMESVVIEELFEPVLQSNILALYGKSGLAKNIINLPASDAVKELMFYSRNKDNSRSGKINQARMDRFLKLIKFYPAMEQLLIVGRLFGSAYLYIGYDNSGTILENRERLADPVTNAGPNDIYYLEVIRPDYYAGSGTPSPNNIPEVYRFRFSTTGDTDGQSGAQERTVDIHGSRIIPFFNTLTANIIPVSALVPAYESICQYLDFLSSMSQQSRNNLTRYLKSPYFRGAGEARAVAATKRLQDFANTGGANVSMIGDEEEVFHFSHQQSDAAAIAQTFREQISADTGIPSNVIFYEQHNGLTNANEQDFKLYYEYIEGIRIHHLEPIIDDFFERIGLDYEYEIKSPAVQTENERLEGLRVAAETDNAFITNITTLMDRNLITRETGVTLLYEQGIIPENVVPEERTPVIPAAPNNGDQSNPTDGEEDNNASN